MEGNEQEIRELRRLIRDLVALATAPAGWVGREPAQIADGVADILLHTLRAQAAYLALQSGNLIEGIRNTDYPGFEVEVPRLRAGPANNALLVDTMRLPGWRSQLRVAIYPIGVLGDDAFVAVGCARADFPSEAESLLLSVAGNQAAVAVQAARLRGDAEMERHRLQQVREKLQVALEAAQRLAAIVESSEDAIVSKDLNGIVTSWNRAAERIFGYTAGEMIGRSIRTVIPPELQEDEDRILATIARGERIEHFETVRITKEGERIDVSLTISPVKNESGRIVGAAKIARDITERKRAERALHTAEKLASVGRLAATVAHEINNPLEAVTNLVYIAKDRAVRPDVREFLTGAEQELARVSQITKQTLGFYRESNGASVMRVGEALRPLLSVFASRSRNKGVEICSEIVDDPEIWAVPTEIRQVIANLLSNSIDAVQSGGRIRIRVSGRGAPAGVRITIADSGSGISAKVRQRLFEPFFTTKKDVGTGLGLWICKSIVDKHHGRICVRSSTVPGRSWTVFSVFLPALVQESVQDALTQAV